MTEWDDRWVDAALHELHGQRPPDLSARVVSALERGPVDASPVVVTASPRRSRRVSLAVAVVASLAALVGVTLLLVQRHWATPAAPEVTDRVVARLAIEVQSGVVSCVEAALGGSATSRHPAGTSASFDARPGNRLRCAVASQMRLGPFGVVECSADSELEVKSMEFTWKSGVVAASSLTVVVVAGVVTWHNLARSETAAARETLRMHAPSDGEESLLAQNAELKRQLERLQRENEALKAQPSREPAAATVAADAPKVQPEAPPQPQTAMVFTDDRYATALAGVDWKTMGAVTHEMGPMLAKLVEALKNGDEITPDMQLAIQGLNSKLVAQVPALLKAGLPGYGPNGAYTHPLVAANVLASTLAAAGQPLDDAQRAKIDGLVRAFSVESQSIADAQGEFDLERLLAETEMKDRFFRELGSHLAPAQSDTMNPLGASNYDGANLFSAGLVTSTYAEPVSAAGPAEFARIASNRLGEDLGLDDAAAAKVRAIVERVGRAAPELWSEPADSAEKGRMLRHGRAKAAMKRQIEIMREIQRTVPMTPEQLKKFRASKGVLVPLPR